MMANLATNVANVIKSTSLSATNAAKTSTNQNIKTAVNTANVENTEIQNETLHTIKSQRVMKSYSRPQLPQFGQKRIYNSKHSVGRGIAENFNYQSLGETT